MLASIANKCGIEVEILFIRIFLSLFSRITPTTDVSSSNIPMPTTDEKLQHHDAIEVRTRKNTRTSMDLRTQGTLSFHNIRYTISVGRRAKREKEVIHGISGVLKSGMNAIMGENCGVPSMCD